MDNVFRDSAVSGGLFEREAMQRLIDYIVEHSCEKYVIIFDDLKRFARDVNVHLKLKRELISRGATLECLNFQFEDSPEGRFIETIIAAQAQLEREQNKRQVIQKMKARMEAGYWCLQPPFGYEYQKTDEHGRIISLKKREAKILKEALEGFAECRFRNQVQVVNFLNEKKIGGKKGFYLNKVKYTLMNPIYAGYFEYPRWGVSWRKGKHEPLISLEVFQKIQDKINKKVVSERKDDRPEFPLRRLICCESCGKPYTASFVKGRNKYYPFYTCYNKSCKSSIKNIKKDTFEQHYIELLKLISPQNSIVAFYKDILLRVYNDRYIQEVKQLQEKESIISKKSKQIDLYLERICQTSNLVLIENYEKKITELQKEIDILKSKSQKVEKIDFESLLNEVIEFIQNPAEYWLQTDLQGKSLIHTLVFDDNLKYTPKRGFRTAQTSLLFRLKEESTSAKYSLVEFAKNNWNQIFEEVNRFYIHLKKIKRSPTTKGQFGCPSTSRNSKY